MENFQNQTIETYRNNFKKYVERTPQEIQEGEFKIWMDTFISYLEKDSVIFEIGSAHGRDARYFRDQGFKVFCTDVIPEALDKLSEEGFETAPFDFRDTPKEEWKNVFDGFFANAVLLHAPQEVFENTLQNIHVILKSDGIAAFSLKTGSGEAISNEKLDAPRYFKYYLQEELEAILARYPFEILYLNRADAEKWLHVVMKKK